MAVGDAIKDDAWVLESLGSIWKWMDSLLNKMDHEVPISYSPLSTEGRLLLDTRSPNLELLEFLHILEPKLVNMV